MSKAQILSLAADYGRGSDVLLPKYGTETYSPVFSVVDVPVRVIAFGLSKEGSDPDAPYESEYRSPGDKVAVLRVWYPQSAVARDGCGKLMPPDEWFEQPLRLNGRGVQLSLEHNEVVLDGYGHYRVVYRGSRREEVQVVWFRDTVVRGGASW